MASTNALPALTLLSAECMSQWHGAGAACLLSGDRLARLAQMRLHLQQRPVLVALHLDATDQLLWGMAMADAGIVATPCGERLQLDHGAGSRMPGKVRA